MVTGNVTRGLIHPLRFDSTKYSVLPLNAGVVYELPVYNKVPPVSPSYHKTVAEAAVTVSVATDPLQLVTGVTAGVGGTAFTAA